MDQNILFLDKIRSVLTQILALLLFILLSFAASPALAQTHISKSTVGDLLGNTPSTLDWKTNEIAIPFDLPEMVWVDKVEVLVSAQPTGALRHRRNLRLRINNSDPIILNAQGLRFDARVKLAQKHLRRTGNKLYISGISTSSTCAGPNHAGWEINKDRSLLVFYGRNMTRDLTLRDLTSMWDDPTDNISRIGVKVVGDDKFRHESLIAQAMALRTGQTPQLRTAFAGNHLDIIAGLRPDVKSYIRRTKNRTGSGAEIILDESRPPRLILTGDTPEDVRNAVNAFAIHKLPETRRVITTPHELALQPGLSTQRVVFDKSHKLLTAGVLNSPNSWVTPSMRFNFDTPHASQKAGQVILRINGNTDTLAENSTLDVKLNGRRLGDTQIDKRRKTVRFDIPEGYLVGSDNLVEITPDLRPNSGIETCDVVNTRPGFSLGLGSKVVIKGKIDKGVHDIANIAASTGPFFKSKNVVIYSTSTRTNDRKAALRLIAEMSLKTGQAWTHAEFIEGSNPVIPTTDNILIIGPKTRAMDALLDHAPKALRLALNGQSIPDTSNEKIASRTLRVASLDDVEAFKLAAATSAQSKSRYNTGLMAIHDDPDSLQTIGVITTRPGVSFAALAPHLLKPEIWNGLSGSVAQWDKDKAIMVQTSLAKQLTTSPAKYNNFDLNPFKSFDWGQLDTMTDDMKQSLHDIWEQPRRNIVKKNNDFWANIKSKQQAFFEKKYNQPREVKPILTPDTTPLDTRQVNIDQPLTKTQPTLKVAALPIPRTKPALPTLKLRGSYDGNESLKLTPLKPNKLAGLAHKSSDIGTAFSNMTNAVKQKAVRSYNAVDQWGEAVNNSRKSQGKAEILPATPILFMILIIFGLLILLSLTAPKQLRY